MPFTYITRKRQELTLFRIETAAGKPRYVFARPGKSKGEPVEALPAGYRVSEHVGGKVALVKDEPRLVLPAEVDAVEAEVGKLPNAKDFRVVAQHDRIEIYAKVPPGFPNRYLAMSYGQYRPAGASEPEEPDKYDPVLRFVLFDPEHRRYRADQIVPRWRVEWSWLGRMGDVAELAGTHVPALASKPVRDVYRRSYDFDIPTLREESTLLTIEFEMPSVPPEGGLFPIPSGMFGEGPRPRRGDTRPPRPLTSVHRLKVTLIGSKPPIWRRVLVPSDITFGQLHDIVQDVMGWRNEHLHQFTVDGMDISDPRYLDDVAENDEDLLRLNEMAPYAKTRFRYQYDFGDSWDHEIVVEAVQPSEPGHHFPVCVAGQRACPPEDVGGIWAYAHFVEAISNRKHPDHRDYRDWWEGSWDAEAFDLDAINARLARTG
jgi:hypothetical protein